MKAAVVLAILIAVWYVFSVQRGNRLREAERASEAAAEEMYRRQDERLREQRESMRQQARERRDEAVRRNARERDRIAAKYPDLYRDMERKAGGDLRDCIVTEHEDRASVTLRVQCGESAEEASHGSSR